MKPIVVSGRIEIPEEIRNKKFKSYIKVLDTSFEDGPAVTIAEIKTDYNPSVQAKKNTISFEVNIVAEIDRSHDYTLSVLIDLDNDGKLSKNDYIQNQSYTIISQGKLRKDIVIGVQKI